MLKSMTGYGRREAVTEGKKILVEIKSVNHRYSDYNIKVQRHLGFLEDKIRKYVSSSITRGKVDIYLNVENYETADKQITLNKEIAKNYIDVLYQLRDEFGLKDDITVSNVASNPDIFSTERVEEDEEALWIRLKPFLTAHLATLSQCVSVRAREYKRTCARELTICVHLSRKWTSVHRRLLRNTVTNFMTRLKKFLTVKK